MKLIILNKISPTRRQLIAEKNGIPPKALDFPYCLAGDDTLVITVGVEKAGLIMEFKSVTDSVQIIMGERSSEEDHAFADYIVQQFKNAEKIVINDESLLIIEKSPNFDPSKIITLSEADINKHATHLLEKGYVVIPVLSKQELHSLHDDAKMEMKKFPEYKSPSKPDTVFIAGGFGALGNPSAAHNPATRSIRLRTMIYIVPIIKRLNELEDRPNRMIEQMFDRLSVRRKGTSASTEAWHRDQAALPSVKDDILGGWINLDKTEDQFFSGVPETHNDTRGSTGFAMITPEEIAMAKKNKKKVTIPAGSHFIFYQNLIHEVVAKKMKYDAFRLYTGYRLTDLSDALFSEVNRKVFDNKIFRLGYGKKTFNFKQMVKDQAVMPTPSGQHPPMYSVNNLRYPKQRYPLQDWSKATFKDMCLGTVVVKDEDLTVVYRFMDSLKDYGLPLYREYADYEWSILEPRKSWKIPFYGKMVELNL